MTASNKLIQAAAGVGGGEFYPYTIENSARFDGASYLSRTFTTPTDGKKYTVSSWLKLTDLAQTLPVIMSAVGNPGFWEEYIATYINVFRIYNGSGSGPYLVDTAKRRDPSSWYHFHLKVDTTQATASDRMVMTVNGQAITVAASSYPALNSAQYMNAAVAHRIGYLVSIAGDYYFNGYMADFVFIDGTAYAATDLGEDKNGVWIPKDPSGLTFGNNGFWLDFADSANLGNDVSGNNNDFTSSGLTSSDQMIDTPTNNFCTLNPVDGVATAEGSLQQPARSASWATCQSTMAFPKTGKWYWEAVVSGSGTSDVGAIGISADPANLNHVGSTTNSFSYMGANGYIYEYGAATPYGATYGAGDIIGILWDADNGDLTFYKNGTSQGVAKSGLDTSINYRPAVSQYNAYVTNVNFGQNGTFNGATTAGGNSDANGLGDFKYTVPTDALALCTANLPEPTLGPNSAENVTDYFAPVLYTGNGTAIGSGGKAVTGVGFQPDMVWIKNRDAADNHMVFDDVRGVTKYISTNSTSGETTDTESLSTFDTDGFTLGNNVAVNTSTEDYVAWVLKKSSGFFDVVTYTGTAANQTVAHNLDNPPNIVIAKIYQSPTYGSWLVDPDSGGTQYMLLESTAASLSADFGGGNTVWNNTAPTSSVFSLGSNTNANESGKAGIAYLFSNMDGMCKIGSYTGNGSADGPFIYTGFRPAYFLLKKSSGTGWWYAFDAERNTYNLTGKAVFPNSSSAETDYPGGASLGMDFLSNGVKLRGYQTEQNASGSTYIYMAFAEMPFKYSRGR